MNYTNMKDDRVVNMFLGCSEDLCDLKLGSVVIYHPEGDMFHDVGHIVGFNYNPFNELIIMVQLASEGAPRGIHPSNLQLARRAPVPYNI